MRREAIAEQSTVLATVPALMAEVMRGLALQPLTEQRLRLDVCRAE